MYVYYILRLSVCAYPSCVLFATLSSDISPISFKVAVLRMESEHLKGEYHVGNRFLNSRKTYYYNVLHRMVHGIDVKPLAPVGQGLINSTGHQY